MFDNGIEKITGASLLNADLGKLAHILFGEQTFHFAVPIAAKLSGGSIRPFERIVKGVAIAAHDVAPVSTALVVKLKVGGTVLSQEYSLPAGATETYVDVIGDGNGGADPFTSEAEDEFGGIGVLVAADTALKVQIITPSDALDVTVTPVWRNRKL